MGRTKISENLVSFFNNKKNVGLVTSGFIKNRFIKSNIWKSREKGAQIKVSISFHKNNATLFALFSDPDLV